MHQESKGFKSKDIFSSFSICESRSSHCRNTIKNVISDNDLIYPGSKLQKDLFDLMIALRRNQVEVPCNSREIFIQIKENPTYCQYLRFLWRH